MIDFASGEILPNKAKDAENQKKANATIIAYKLNANNHPLRRVNELKRYKKLNDDEPLDDFSFRFYLERGI